MHHWKTIVYLAQGNARQQKAFQALKELQLFEKLSDFDPLLVGTVPIGIDIPSSDLDIICCATDFNLFNDLIHFHFKQQDEFWVDINPSRYLANFNFSDFEIEIFARNMPSDQQPGFRHMLIESKIIDLLGPVFKKEIRDLKLSGYKTEPAFGQLLSFENDPYEELLAYEQLSLSELKSKLLPFIKKYTS